MAFTDELWEQLNEEYDFSSGEVIPLVIAISGAYGLVWNNEGNRYFMIWGANPYFRIQDCDGITAVVLYSVADWPKELHPRLITWPEYKHVSVSAALSIIVCIIIFMGVYVCLPCYFVV